MDKWYPTWPTTVEDRAMMIVQVFRPFLWGVYFGRLLRRRMNEQ